MTLLRVVDVTRRFGGLTAVDGVSFDVHEGTIKALIGPNGAGKSTLFNVLTGFDRPDGGQVFFDEQEITGTPARANVLRGLARTFQNTQLFDEMTALENVLVGAAAHRGAGFVSAALRLPRAARENAQDLETGGRLLRLVGLDDWADVRASDLPAGLRRLLEIARALATGPRLLLLDEPAAGLNSSETAELAQALYRLRGNGVTILVVEHDMGLVMEVSDDIVVIDRGRKIAEGPPRMIQKDPVVIAAYLGGAEEDE